jgi:hypothetical protein
MPFSRLLSFLVPGKLKGADVGSKHARKRATRLVERVFMEK